MQNVQNSGFQLKKKYNGINRKTQHGKVNNLMLSDEIAIDLIDNHPTGADLFDKVPDNLDEIREAVSNGEPSFEDQVKKLKKPALVAKATELGLDTDGTADVLKARIIENGPEPKAPEED